MEAPPSPQTKDEAAPLYVKAKTKAAEAKAETEAATAPPAPAEAPALIEAPAGGALVAAETEPEAKPETKPEASPETNATEPQIKAKAGDAEDCLASNKASLVAASMLAQICERAFMEHQLAARHFTFYSFCAHAPVLSVCLMCACTCPYRPDCAVTAPLCAGVFFVPLNILIAATSILAFVAGESSVNNENNMFNIVVGCLAALGVFWNSCDRMLSYKSRADMHTGAKMICKELLADLDYALIKFESFSEAQRKLTENDPMDERALLDIKTKIDQVQESCTSAVPDAINQIFKQMNTLVLFDLEIQGLDKGDRKDVQALRIANVLLCKEITRCPMWPMKLPGAGHLRKARETLADEYKIKKTDLSEIRKANLKEKEAA